MYDMPKWAGGLTTPLYTAASEYMTFYSREIAIAIISIVILGLVAYAIKSGGGVYSPRKQNFKRGSRMVGQAREAEERVLISDKVSDGLEDLFNQGKLTAERKAIWAERFANLCDLRDLISSKQLTLVQQLRMNAKLRKKRPTEPVPIPGPAPHETEPKNAFDAIVRRAKFK